jgi:hypothetical protein
MSLWHPTSKAILESLVKSPGGFQLNPKRGPAILATMTDDPTAMTAFHDMLGLLQAMHAKPAADALRTLVLENAMKKKSVPQRKSFWG